jgi:hypothetical protein
MTGLWRGGDDRVTVERPVQQIPFGDDKKESNDNSKREPGDNPSSATCIANPEPNI